MIDEHAHPPRIAQMLVIATVPASDAEPVVGDLLEEFRAVRHPSPGRLTAAL